MLIINDINDNKTLFSSKSMNADDKFSDLTSALKIW